MKRFDIVPFSLPNCPPGEIWFEESRDIREVVVRFRDNAPRKLTLFYRQDKWPRTLHERRGDLENPAAFGWVETDDWFNGKWQQAALRKEVAGSTATLQFKGLSAERIEGTPEGYDVEFRRTMALRLSVPDWSRVRGILLYTASAPARSTLRVELDAGKKTEGKRLRLSGYNARIARLRDLRGATLSGRDTLILGKGKNRSFTLEVEHMAQAHPYSGDAGLVEFHLDHDSFTISLEALAKEGPVWYAEEGVFVTPAEDPTTFAGYRRAGSGARTINQRVADRPEQSYARAFLGQPRPHAVPYSFGCKHSPQRFWLEPNGDLVLHKDNLTRINRPGASAERFLNRGNARFFFGLERWISVCRFTDPPPVPIYNLRFRKGTLLLEERCLCTPLNRSILDGELGFDEPTVALVRFRFENTGDAPVEARFAIRYSGDSRRSQHYLHLDPNQTEYLVPKTPLDPLSFSGGRDHRPRMRDREVLRCVCDTAMEALVEGEAVVLRQALKPGERCEALLKIPYLAPEPADEAGCPDPAGIRPLPRLR